VPRAKVYRAFSQLDEIDDATCERLVGAARINHAMLVDIIPRAAAWMVGALWPVGWIVSHTLSLLPAWIPVPKTALGATLAITTTTALFAGATFLISRDVCLWLGVRRELRRVNCRRCGQPLVGLPIRAAGDDNDPGKRFVRCAECGKLHNLLEAGLTPRDLIPYEQRGVGEVGEFARSQAPDVR
jgi:hypothetical protein